ncbi:unnamed protein product [Prunus armeniaca]|uniref:Late embryogenesis abundant protein LEA-2 subgroup domain-containing protein n=1 Tax=Prunus armeniaca TaxID=36596 RepID=A0A6J5VG81_PRUAR|nr:unnamed protein product [Prunus armeniaca]
MFGRSGLCCFCFCLCYITYFLFFLAFFIFWSIFLPQEPKFTITNASLTQFNLTNTSINNNTLHYNLTLEITIRNPNKKVGLYYRRILFVANYRKKRFALVRLNSTPFYQGHKNTTIVNANLEGQQLMRFKERDISNFNSETANGVYSIDVKIALRIGIRFGKVKTGYFKIPRKSDCKLKVPLSTSFNGTFWSGFQTTECKSFHIFGDPDAA